MRVGLAAALGLLVIGAVGAHAKRPPAVDREPLVTVSAPTAASPAVAHPHVNVSVGFGRTSTDVAADPASFRAKVNGHKINDLFAPVERSGAVVGARARIPAQFLRVGRGGKNVLRVTIRSVRPPTGRVLRDADRVTFRATSAANGAPVARLSALPDVLLAGVPVQLDATTSEDPDGDDLTYHWDFGDGATADGPTASHPYADVTTDRTVTLTVSDGQATAQATVTLHAAPTCDAAALPGTLRIDADQTLDLGPVAVGATATRTIVIRNTDVTPGSQVKAAVASDTAAFAVSDADVTLGPGASMPVTVTFAPTTAGHQLGRIEIAACASDPTPVTLVAHGYGGTAPGTGPTLAQSPTFNLAVFGGARLGIVETRADGLRLPIEVDFPWCAAGDGSGTHDFCTRNADCDTAGETCVAAPAGASLLDPVDFCGDGQNLFVLTDNGSTDTRGLDEENVGVAARVGLDATGRRSGNDAVLRRITDGTTRMACDGKPIASGLVFLAQFRAVDPGTTCVRGGREALVAIRKSNGSFVDTGVDRIDQVEGLDACQDDIDPVAWMAVDGGGTHVFVVPGNTGLYQVTPTPGLFVTDVADRFQVHPDGSLLLSRVTDGGTTSVVELFKVDPAQAATGAVHLDQLAPCARFPLPSNARAGDVAPHFVVGTMAADRVGNPDPTVLVTVLSTPNSAPIADTLALRATVAFAAPSGSAACTPLGVVALEAPDSLTF